jgi:polyhydroxybutyrate depolymerase
MRRGLLVAVVALFGCGDDGGPGAPDGPAAGGADAPAGAADAPGGRSDAAAVVGCDPSLPPSPLDQTRTLEHGGLTRTYHVHVPALYDGTPTPLVLNFHGYFASASLQIDWSNLIEKSDATGFVVVHPEGSGTPQRWNAGNCCPDASNTVDDVGFTAAMLDDLARTLCLDPKRIYSTGFSNGGMFSYRLACELGDRIAAIAPVAASSVYAGCSPTRAVPVLAMHGTDDPVNPFVNGEGSAEIWRDLDGCTGDAVETFANGDTTCRTWETCAGGAEVTFCTVQGGGHTWPGGDVPESYIILQLGHTTTYLNATDAIWEFFSAHPLP